MNIESPRLIDRFHRVLCDYIRKLFPEEDMGLWAKEVMSEH